MNRHDFSVAYAKRAGITQEASAKTCEEVFYQTTSGRNVTINL